MHTLSLTFFVFLDRISNIFILCQAALKTESVKNSLLSSSFCQVFIIPFGMLHLSLESCLRVFAELDAILKKTTEDHYRKRLL